MSKVAQITTVSLNSQLLPDNQGEVPDLVHLLPMSDGRVQTNDARGPYHVTNAQDIIDASFADSDRLPIDENHAIDLAAPKGLPAPSRGWITAMQARDDGIWGKVEWSEEGRDLLKARAYRYLSPVIGLPNKTSKTVTGILRASLVNRPNLREISALNQETDDMSFQKNMAGALGLSADASEADISAALTTLKDAGATQATALQSQLSDIGTALGVAEGGDVLAAAKSAQSSGDGDTIVALQSTVAELSGQVTALQSANQTSAATTFVDTAISEMRVGVKASREQYIAMHQKDPSGTEAIIGGLPKLNTSGTTLLPPKPADGVVSLNADQSAVAAQLGLSDEDYATSIKDEGNA
ncbi:phage protease [Parasedimentitalea huanghaiensis]|uniref:Phage I-like protein n=1 Tax=Parasedimentitalea huanghaiensis TaxID=2682100 RepID=A0A6L6WLK9_9RHOB|nr:phage protease [Zongyanglinia huanghaiensis]MVO16847.1 hypothetical protein [Zongyanglinia huanghaiensis]